MLQEVDVHAQDPSRLEELIGPERAARFESNARAARTLLSGRRVINVNSTAAGGGVAELLETLLAYVRGVEIDARWVVIEGDPRFFEITKRIHNHLYGSAGDGGPLGPAEHASYEQSLRPNAEALRSFLRPGDVVILHDPQTAGLAPAVQEWGAPLVWRCHVGRDTPNQRTQLAWDFLREYIDDVDGFVFTRAEFAPDWIDRDRLHVITPSIDPFCPKNEDLSPGAAQAILQQVGILDGADNDSEIKFSRRDGSPGRVNRAVDILQTGPAASPDVPLVVQLSRWDRIKDMQGVLESFAEHVDPTFGAHLALIGPAVHGVSDDPEAGEVLRECMEAWSALPQSARARIHLGCVPMHDPDEAAIIANALQRHAAIVTQKSLAEGFGLTVVEAMWKRRAVVATRVGGIVDQITHGEDGLLLDDPFDLSGFGAAINRLLGDGPLVTRLGARAYERAHRDFLGDSHLEHYATLFAALLSKDPGAVGNPQERTDMNEAWLQTLDLETCLVHLRSGEIGRLGIVTDSFPIVLPVNYRMVETNGVTWLALRTRPGNVIDQAATNVALEVDDIDKARHGGWSVLVRGTLQRVDPDSASFRDLFDSEPWLVTDRDTWLIIEPSSITGRELHPSEPAWPFHASAYL